MPDKNKLTNQYLFTTKSLKLLITKHKTTPNRVIKVTLFYANKQKTEFFSRPKLITYHELFKSLKTPK